MAVLELSASEFRQIGKVGCPPYLVIREGAGGGRLRGRGGCCRQADGTAGLPSDPEMPCAPRQLRLVPVADVHRGSPKPPQSTQSGHWLTRVLSRVGRCR